jgi:alpha-ketoglutaric semialdehyde dehydrogenase
MTLTGKNILGEKLSSESSVTFHAINPAVDKKLDTTFHEATINEVDNAVKQASEAFQVYRTKSGKEKAQFLETIAEEILAIGDELIKRCMEETGLPEARLVGERGRTVNQLKLFAQLVREGSWVDARIDTADAERKPLPKPDVRSMLRALGPVGIFGASNFPLAFSVAGGDTASALAAGCTVVVKGHPAHPGTSELVGLAIQRAVKKCNLPAGTFSLVQGKSTAVGLAIVQHPLITAIGFTGSYRGGKAIFDEANKRTVPIPVYAEMGSTNPVFILPGALKERKEKIATDLAASVTQGTGQFCTNPGLVFSQSSDDQKQFFDALINSVSNIDAGTMLTADICNAYKNGIDRLTKHPEIITAAKGKTSDGSGSKAQAYVLQSTVSSFISHHEFEEEIFGPSTLAVTATSKAELLQAAKNLHGHLTATLHATESDLKEYAELISILEQKVGRLILNGYPTGVEVTHAMVHGGPFPSTTDSRSTSVGTAAITRFVRAVCYQSFPSSSLPAELHDGNPLGIWRLINGERKQQ